MERYFMKYHAISAALIIAAIAFELAGLGKMGSDMGAGLFVVSVSFEAWFWIRLGGAKRSRRRQIVGS